MRTQEDALDDACYHVDQLINDLQDADAPADVISDDKWGALRNTARANAA
jgi:hypothetical protein